MDSDGTVASQSHSINSTLIDDLFSASVNLTSTRQMQSDEGDDSERIGMGLEETTVLDTMSLAEGEKESWNVHWSEGEGVRDE